MHRCYIDKLWLDEWCVHPDQKVPKEVADRFVKVVRIKSDEKIALFDGQGLELQGFFLANGSIKDGVLLKESPPTSRIVLLQAALIEAKIAETIKRTTEFGIDDIIIFPSARSESFVCAKLEKRVERLRDISIDASRQSGRLFVPSISFAKDISDAVDKAQAEFGIYGDVDGEKNLSDVLEESLPKKSYSIVIGPEGGLNSQEKQLLRKNHYHPTLWSPFTLRSELASLGALTLINAHLGRA